MHERIKNLLTQAREALYSLDHWGHGAPLPYTPMIHAAIAAIDAIERQMKCDPHAHLLDQAAALLREWQNATGCGIEFTVQLSETGEVERIIPTPE